MTEATATRLTLAQQARALAQVVEDAVRYGLPEPATFGVGRSATPQLITETFEQVEAWAAYLEVESTRDTHRDRDFIYADADLTDHPEFGIHVQVTCNRLGV